jgi:hypothetical protein
VQGLAAWRRFVALRIASDLSKLDLPVFQIDGLHLRQRTSEGRGLVSIGIGHKHPLVLVEGQT